MNVASVLYRLLFPEGLVMANVVRSMCVAFLLVVVSPVLLFSQSRLPYDYPPVLINVNDRIIKLFRVLDADLAGAAGQISKTGLTGPEASKVLKKLCTGKAYAVDCAAVDTKGVMVTLEPGIYKRYEGTDISKQEQVATMLSTKKPVFSKVFKAEEGFDAVDLERPVFSASKEFMGSVSILVKPEILLASVIEPLVRGIPTEIWVMQKDGRILYDAKREEIGKMLFTDPLYGSFPDLVATGKKISKQPLGNGVYEFYSKETKRTVAKEAFWTTVGLYGTQWRLIATRYLNSN